VDKPIVFDENAVKTNNFIESEFVFPCLQHCASPTLKPIAWRPLSFNFEARPAISE
jgi:hypothetical protein